MPIRQCWLYWRRMLVRVRGSASVVDVCDMHADSGFLALCTLPCHLSIRTEVKKLDRNACVAELSKLHVHLPVKLPNDNSEVSCTVTMH